MPVGACRLVAADPVAEIDSCHETSGREEIQHSVDARDADAISGRTKPLVEFLRRQATVLFVEILDDRAACIPAPETRVTQPVEGVRRPGRIGGAHRAMIPILINRGSLPVVETRMVLILVALLALTAGCGAGPVVVGSGPTKVVAAFYPLAYAAEQVGRPAVTVENLTPAGAEPHDLELTPREVGDVIRADLVLYLGAGFQPAVADAVGRRHGPSLQLLPDSASGDPHVWLDPRRFAEIVRAVGRALDRPRSAARLVGRLDLLDTAYRRGLAGCRRREIVTSHAAFGYLARRYGLRQVPLAGLAPEAEPGPRAIERLVAEVRRTRATTVFFETLVSPKLAQTVARAAGARTAVLSPLEGLTAAELARGENYFTVMRSNLRTLREALGCP
jgi:zinc transport system substrate-binding protein